MVAYSMKSITWLFEKDHLARAFWGIVIALMMFCLGLLVNSLKGPTKVEVVNAKKTIDSVIVITDSVSSANDEKTIKLLNELINASNLKSNKHIIEKQNRIEIPSNYTRDPATVVLDEFRLPQNTRGYSEANFGAIGKIAFENEAIKKDQVTTLNVDVFDSLSLNKFTPFILEFQKKNSSHNYTLAWKQDYVLKSKFSVIKFVANIQPGTYYMHFGTYAKNELDNKYPKKYQIVKEVQITE
jgi:hypothetical protein